VRASRVISGTPASAQVSNRYSVCSAPGLVPGSEDQSRCPGRPGAVEVLVGGVAGATPAGHANVLHTTLPRAALTGSGLVRPLVTGAGTGSRAGT
jgi:hypothetical protein